MALRLMHAVAGGIMRLAHMLQLGLDMAQLGGLLFQIGLGFFNLAEIFFLLGLGFVLAQQPQQFLLFFLVALQLMEFLGDRRLRLQFRQIRVKFAQDIFNPHQVFARVVQAILGFAAAFLVLGNAGGLFQENPQFFGTRLDDARNHALADDRVSARTKAGAHENILDVAPPYRLVVDVIRRRAVARQSALDGDFSILAPLPGRFAETVVEYQFNR